MKTLVVDDDAVVLEALTAQLAFLGQHDVLRCERAADAMRLLQEGGSSEIALIFCDLQMPGIDGVEFVRYLARIGYRGSVALISGEDARVLQTVQTLARARGVAMIGALSKPTTVEQLRLVLDGAALHRAALPIERAGSLISAEDLDRAICLGELVNHYQPKIDLKNGSLIGVEALVRWRRDDDTLIAPDRFVPVAEENGLIDALSEAVLTQALMQARRWHDDGLPVQVSVNVSMDNLESLDFPDLVARLARQCGVALSTLVLEVTESRLMKDVRAPLDILSRLRLKRIGLSIDDFGTGHSSLAQLRDIPFDELKLDRSFVHGMVEQPALRAIVQATLDMAHGLGLKSVAEGVETFDEWQLLQALGCDVAQGFYVARPMPGPELLRWAVGWHSHTQAAWRH